jgi:putative transposase
MPRKARIDAPGALHHVIVRGIERKAIFKDDADRTNFLERLGDIFTAACTPCYAWALMTNHVHLLVRSGIVPLATLMRRLLTGYAIYFNRRYRRHGQLFQNRYKSMSKAGPGRWRLDPQYGRMAAGQKGNQGVSVASRAMNAFSATVTLF